MIRSLTLLAGFSLLCAFRQDAQISDDEAKTHIADCKKDLPKCKSDGDFVAFLEKLGSKKNAKILEELKAWLGKGSSEVRIAAAEQIAAYPKEVKAADALISSAKSAGSHKELVEFAAKCIAGVAKVGVRAKA